MDVMESRRMLVNQSYECELWRVTVSRQDISHLDLTWSTFPVMLGLTILRSRRLSMIESSAVPPANSLAAKRSPITGKGGSLIMGPIELRSPRTGKSCRRAFCCSPVTQGRETVIMQVFFIHMQLSTIPHRSWMQAWLQVRS